MTESFEQKEIPIRSDELLELINNLKFKESTPFYFNGSEYQILWLERSEIDEDGEAWFHASTQIDGFDIYLLKSLSKAEKKKKVFHEILEADLAKQGHPQAHDIALAEEERIFGKRLS